MKAMILITLLNSHLKLKLLHMLRGG